MPDKFLIACFDFPPNKGIGGRRWAKFAKGLVRSGNTVHVIKADPIDSNEPSGWAADAQIEGLVVHSIPRTYPAIISEGPTSFGEKLLYRWHIERIKHREPGTIYDIAIGWEKNFSKKTLEIIEQENITKFIATGAPFNLLYYAARIKAQFPHIQLLCDFRDPWLNAVNYGMANLNDKRKQAERAKFDFVMKHADVVTAPNRYMLEDMRAMLAPDAKAHLAELPHLFDFDDLAPYLKTEETRLPDSDQISILYAGSVYLGLEEHLKQLGTHLDTLKLENLAIIRNLNFRFFTTETHVVRFFEGVPEVIEVHPPIGKQVFNEIKQADALMILLAEHNKDFLTTKFFEYLPFKKPLIFIGAYGEAAKFIETNQLGVVVNSLETLSETLLALRSKTLKFNSNVDINTYSLEARVKLLLDLLT